MTEYRLVAEPRADLDAAAAYHWYESERAGLGLEFLDELRATYDRITAGPQFAAHSFAAFPTPCTSLPKAMSS